MALTFHTHKHKVLKRAVIAAFFTAACVCMLALWGCGDADAAKDTNTQQSASTHNAFAIPSSITDAQFSKENATWQNDFAIDSSNANAGFVGACGQSASRLKFQIICNGQSYNYDLPQDGTPIVCPVNMDSGRYTLRIMQNTTANNYIEVMSTTVDVALDSQFVPFLTPNVFCSFDNNSTAVQTARQLAAGATSESEALEAIYDYIVDNISYDHDKAAALENATGYVPDPDATLEAKSGICFDYSSLAAAMLRSIGIPCKIVTGYVDPDNIYHSWNMVYIDEKWVTVKVAVDANTWSRIDTTFAAGGYGEVNDQDANYTDRYVY